MYYREYGRRFEPLVSFINTIVRMKSDSDKKKVGRPSKNEEKRKLILDKAKECFVKNGFNHTTLDSIGDAIGFNKAALYYYFKSKEELFIETVQREIIRETEIIKKHIEKMTDGIEKIVYFYNNKANLFFDVMFSNGFSNTDLVQFTEFSITANKPFIYNDILYIANIIKEEINNNLTVEESINSAWLVFDSIRNKNLFGYVIECVATKPEVMKKHVEDRQKSLRLILLGIKNL